MKDTDFTDADLFTDEMEVDLYEFRALMLNGFGGEVDGVDVVVVDKGASGQRSVQFLEKLTQPGSFNNAIIDGAIIRLSAQAWDNVLTLGGLGDKVATEKHSIAQARLDCIRITHPISISVDDDLGGGEAKKHVIWSAQKIA